MRGSASLYRFSKSQQMLPHIDDNLNGCPKHFVHGKPGKGGSSVVSVPAEDRGKLACFRRSILVGLQGRAGEVNGDITTRCNGTGTVHLGQFSSCCRFCIVC